MSDPAEELYDIPEAEQRQAMIDQLPINESVAIARRIDLTFGTDPAKLAQHTKQVRGILDQQTHRTRRRLPKQQYKVENGSFLTRDGALMIVAVVTRSE